MRSLGACVVCALIVMSAGHAGHGVVCNVLGGLSTVLLLNASGTNPHCGGLEWTSLPT